MTTHIQKYLFEAGLAEASDADIDQFTKSACWEFSLALQKKGLEGALLMRIYRDEPSYEHAFAINNSERAVDVEGRRTFEEMIAKWQRYFKEPITIVRGQAAKEVYKDMRPSASLIKRAKELIDENPGVYLKR